MGKIGLALIGESYMSIKKWTTFDLLVKLNFFLLDQLPIKIPAANPFIS